MEPARRKPVVDVTLQPSAVTVDEQASRARALAGLRFWDDVYRWVTRCAAVGVLVILGGVIV